MDHLSGLICLRGSTFEKIGRHKVFQIPRVPAALLRDLEEYATRDRRTIANLLRKIAEDFIAGERAKGLGETA